MYFFNKTCIGYNHIKNNKKCQDYSASFHDEERTIVTCCDGHGGNIYIRSDLGSKFASEAIMKVFKEITPYETRKFNSPEFLDAIKLGILCEWNRLVECHLAQNHITKNSILNLSETEQNKLLNNKIKAYGTTMIGAMVLNNKLLIVHLGDGEALCVKDEKLFDIFPEESDEPVGNITYSMCEDDAYSHIKIGAIDFNDCDGVILCTDGMVNPYQNYDNFNKSMVVPLVNDVLSTGDYSQVELFVENMGRNIGIGDDVSLSFILKNKNIKKIKNTLKKLSVYTTYGEYYMMMYRNRFKKG